MDIPDGEVTDAQLHDGSRLRIRKLARTSDPTRWQARLAHVPRWAWIALLIPVLIIVAAAIARNCVDGRAMFVTKAPLDISSQLVQMGMILIVVGLVSNVIFSILKMIKVVR